LNLDLNYRYKSLGDLIVSTDSNRCAIAVFGCALLTVFHVGSAIAAAPTISRISTDFERNEISISGVGFGSGPNVLLYDTFESPGAATGAVITLAASEEGAWTEFNQYYLPTYAGSGRSGSQSVKVFDGATQNTNQLRLRFDGIQEFFVSYWVYLEGPKYFPGDLVSSPRTFSEDSSFKMLWVFDTDVKGNSSDVVLPTHVGGGRFYLAGNDTNLVTGLSNDWWSWDQWMRVSFWLKANPENPTNPGTIHFDTLSADKGYTQRVFNVPVFDSDGPAQKQFQQMNFPGWIRSIKGSSTNILYDDIYVSTGPNSAARVELGNAAYLDDVTQLELLTIDSWTDTDIQASASTVEEGSMQKFYLYITDSSGETNAQGIPLESPPSQIKSFEVD
jgi:hypothetical protein|tara:strand:- start:150 stop:1316 length:1167 start_codon:yes stop_codon:yes gene_type:complete